MKSGTSSIECIIAGDAPTESRTLAMKSMETKFVMHWIRGEALRTDSRRAHACPAHDSVLSALFSGGGCCCGFWGSSSIVVLVSESDALHKIDGYVA